MGGVLTHAQGSEVQCVKGDPQGLCIGVGRSQARGEGSLCPQEVQLSPAAKALCKGS